MKITLKQKRELAESLTNVVSETLGDRKDRVLIIFKQTSKKDIARGGKTRRLASHTPTITAPLQSASSFLEKTNLRNLGFLLIVIGSILVVYAIIGSNTPIHCPAGGCPHDYISQILLGYLISLFLGSSLIVVGILLVVASKLSPPIRPNLSSLADCRGKLSIVFLSRLTAQLCSNQL